MENTIVVLYKGELTHYAVTDQGNGTFMAGLLKYNGDQQMAPPQKVFFTKQGRHCAGDFNDQDLLDDLYNALQEQQRGGLFNVDKQPKEPFILL